MEDRDTIDLRQFWQVAKENRLKLISVVVFTTLVALSIAFFLPKEYESSLLIRAKSQNKNGISLQASAALALLGGGSTGNLQSYQELLKSRSVLDPVIEQLDLPNKDKVTNETFAKKNLKLTNPKGTDLIEIKATGRTPEEAQFIATSIVNSFQQLLTKINQSEQSLQLKFLTNRINVTKGEMEQAEKNLEQFRQQSKIFVPDEQAKASIKSLTELDQKLAQLRVDSEMNQAKLRGVDSQLRQQNAAMEKFNLADNAIVETIRKKIIEKQINLVALQQRYTDKHPDVVLAKKEIDELTEKLQSEIAKSVQSGINVLNPVQGALLSEKVATETKIIASQAAIDATKQIQAKAEENIGNLSSHSTTYVALERKVRIAQEVYAVLVKNYEQTRIQEAMESMDIQVVDQANLPKQPSAPKKLLIAAMGGMLGIMVSLVYLFVLYRRQAVRFSV